MKYELQLVKKKKKKPSKMTLFYQMAQEHI